MEVIFWMAWALAVAAAPASERVTLPPLRDLAGQTLPFTTKPRLVSFWASWCDDCRAELACINACATGDSACLQACASAHPSGNAYLNALATCMSSYCSTACK